MERTTFFAEIVNTDSKCQFVYFSTPFPHLEKITNYKITFYKCYSCSSACDCNENGALGDLLCNTGDGQCNCKDNFGGRQCDECKDGFYQYPYCYSE